VKIGRTSDNEVVLHAHGVSRRHARIFTRGGRYFVADLGSANGTLFNGKPVPRDREQELRGGDRLSIGSVEFVFAPVAPLLAPDATQPVDAATLARALAPAPDATQPVDAATLARALAPASDATQPVDAATLARALAPASEATRLVASPGRKPRSSARITRARTEQEMRAIEEEDTGRHRTVTELELAAAPAAQGAATLAEMPAVPAPLAQGTETLTQVPAVPAPLAQGTETLTQVPVVSARARGASQPPARAGFPREGAGALSAAERARRRRELSATLGGQFMLWWAQLSPRGKSAAGVLTGLVIVAMAVTSLAVFRSGKRSSPPRGPEPTRLGLTPLPDSFGLGEGVTWKAPDQKVFDLQFASPTRAVVVLHYQASDISKEEVGISLNGVHQGWVPPDTATTGEREIEQVLAVNLLRRDAPNQITFDNVRNPPGQERWRVWNMYVEVVPVPELPVAELLAKARQEAATARRFYELKGVGSENLFKSWKYYRSAWLTLEALETKPDLYEDVRYALRQAAAELDQQCRKLMLDFQRSLQFQDGDAAKATVEEVMRRFPTTEHRCHNLAIEKAYQYELPL
jgi:hypothetical protein